MFEGFTLKRIPIKVAPLLAEDHTVVCADLRGYGDSGRWPNTCAVFDQRRRYARL